MFNDHLYKFLAEFNNLNQDSIRIIIVGSLPQTIGCFVTIIVNVGITPHLALNITFAIIECKWVTTNRQVKQ